MHCVADIIGHLTTSEQAVPRVWPLTIFINKLIFITSTVYSPVNGLTQHTFGVESAASQATMSRLLGCTTSLTGRPGLGFRLSVRTWGSSWCCRSTRCSLPLDNAHSSVNLRRKWGCA